MSNVQPDGEVAAVWVAVDALKPWAHNPRHNDAKAVRRVTESIKRFGFAAPIVARRSDGEVIAGHTRLLAAKALGMDRVPVRFLDLDPADAHLLAVADNRLNELTEWDDQLLASFLGPLMMEHTDAAEVAGFTDEEIQKLLQANSDAIVEALDESDKAKTDFVVLVECRDEDHQRELIQRLMDEGLTVRALT